MKKNSIRGMMKVQQGPGFKRRVLIMCLAVCVCLVLSVFVLEASDNVQKDYTSVSFFEYGKVPYELSPGSTLSQNFPVQGTIGGEYSFFEISMFRDYFTEGNVEVRLINTETGDIILQSRDSFENIPKVWLFETQVRSGNAEDLKEQYTVSDENGYYRLKSGEKYCLEIENLSEKDSVYFLGNETVSYGRLTIDGEEHRGFLNICGLVRPEYYPGRFLQLAVLLADATVLLGLALVLFTDIRPEKLYLVLAVGFGLVTLFAVTPLYGFDMRFQFDSAYVVSNRMLGLEDWVYTPSVANPEVTTLSYYRRVCDDYSMYQFYYHDEAYANYMDMKVGMLDPFVSGEEAELVLVESDLGFFSDPLYMYIPQAAGFALARVMGLGMYPMLQLARLLTYGLYVVCAYQAIRLAPFGKRIFLILSLMPATLVQVVSISRDAVIIGLSFFLIAKYLQMTYSERKPNWLDWAAALAGSVILAPCKMVYAPVALLCLMVIYRHYIRPAGKKGIRIAAAAVAVVVLAALLFLWMNKGLVKSILFADAISVYNTPAYSVKSMIQEPLRTVFVFVNTICSDMGMYLTNAIQLYNIELGANDGILLIVVVLLLLETFCEESSCLDRHQRFLPFERGYMFLIALATFLLLILAAFRWTPLEMDILVGLQGRYLIPVLPLVLLSLKNNRIISVNAQAEIVTRIGCCIFPALYLMNVYLWTIGT